MSALGYNETAKQLTNMDIICRFRRSDEKLNRLKCDVKGTVSQICLTETIGV